VTDERVLVFAPGATGFSCELLTDAGIACTEVHDLAELETALQAGAGALILSNEALRKGGADRILALLRAQPAWSELPVLALSDGRDDDVRETIEAIGNVVVLGEPLRVLTLQSAARVALRARRRQYELRDQVAALRRSEERFHVLATTVHESIWDLDVATGAFWSSESARPMFGRAPGPDAPFNEWTGRRHPEDAPRVSESFVRALVGDASTWSDEYRFRREDGTYVAIFERAHIMRDPKGKAVRVFGVMLDVTDRKRAEETSALHTAIVSSSDDAIVSKRLDGTITTWNQGAERLFGWKAEEAVGRSIGIIIPEDRRAEEADLIGRIGRGMRVEHFETVRRRKDGTPVNISLTLSPIRNAQGVVVGASKVARDITVRKQGEDILKKQSQRLRLLLEAASILLTSDDLDIMLRALFAQISDHLLIEGYAHWVIEDGRPPRLESSAGLPAAALAAIDPVGPDERMRELKRFGLPTAVRMPLVSEGRLRGVLAFASTRTDRFDPDEEEFLRTICHYVTAAGERVRLIHRLRETDRRKDEFLATLAHELRNPLAPVRSSLEVMRLAGDDKVLLERAREMMERQMGQMVRLIDDLLDVSRITRGRLELKQERMSLDSAIRTAIETARPLIDGSKHTLVVEGLDSGIELMADPVRLAQVLSNLLNNAAKYTEPAGRIRLVVQREDSRVAITVEDTGVGIAPEALASVFDLFSQVDRTLERSQGGLGIGLTLVKRLVEMHGGTVEARSEGAGRGAAFTVRLPIFEPATPRSEPQAAQKSARAATGRRILVADDNMDAAESMALVLRMMGNEVHAVHDGDAAVDEAGKFRPEVVLLDIGMPRLNGYDAARIIRSHAWGRGMLLVALTGWGQDDDRKRASEAGFDLHFTKPLEPADLVQIVAMDPRLAGKSALAKEET